MTDVLFVDYVFKTDNEKFDQAKAQLLSDINQHKELQTQEDIKDFVDEFFSEWTSAEVDYDYLFATIPEITTRESELIQKVNSYTSSFKYEEMDIIDQALFLLGYVEYQTIKTPKEVILNELVELAKRYSDEGAPKLINGIMHKVLSE